MLSASSYTSLAYFWSRACEVELKESWDGSRPHFTLGEGELLVSLFPYVWVPSRTIRVVIPLMFFPS